MIHGYAKNSGATARWSHATPVGTMLSAIVVDNLSQPLILIITGSTIELRFPNRSLIHVTDVSTDGDGRWEQRRPTRTDLLMIQSYVNKLAKNRDAAFYFEESFDSADAETAGRQAWTVLRLILGAVGLDLVAHFEGGKGD